jgi:serine/threonine protein kinase
MILLMVSGIPISVCSTPFLQVDICVVKNLLHFVLCWKLDFYSQKIIRKVTLPTPDIIEEVHIKRPIVIVPNKEYKMQTPPSSPSSSKLLQLNRKRSHVEVTPACAVTTSSRPFPSSLLPRFSGSNSTSSPAGYASADEDIGASTDAEYLHRPCFPPNEYSDWKTLIDSSSLFSRSSSTSREILRLPGGNQNSTFVGRKIRRLTMDDDGSESAARIEMRKSDDVNNFEIQVASGKRSADDSRPSTPLSSFHAQSPVKSRHVPIAMKTQVNHVTPAKGVNPSHGLTRSKNSQSGDGSEEDDWMKNESTSSSHEGSLFDVRVLDSMFASESDHRHHGQAEKSNGLSCTLPLEDPHYLVQSSGEGFGLSSTLFVATPCLSRDFNIQALIGSGAFAEVYRVQKLRSRDSESAHARSLYAVKRMKTKIRSKQERERLIREAQVMKFLSCERHCHHIVKFFSAWQEDGIFHIMMEIAQKGTVKDLMLEHIETAKMIPTHTLWHIIHDTCRGLAHMHQHHYVHLDIKPSNLLVCKDGTIKIGDFGLSTRDGSTMDDQEGDPRYLFFRIFVQKIFLIGSFVIHRYMAKELLNDCLRASSADIFSLGISLYEMASLNALKNTGGKENSPFTLPTNGPRWHELRSGKHLSVPNRSLSFNLLLFAMMNPFPFNRPKASEILTLSEVERFSVEPELLQLGLDSCSDQEVNTTPVDPAAAGSINDLHRPMPLFAYFHNNRPSSFDPGMSMV